MDAICGVMPSGKIVGPKVGGIERLCRVYVLWILGSGEENGRYCLRFRAELLSWAYYSKYGLLKRALADISRV